jgi:EmrB/QacA subfamily drug resistance transporter
MLNIMSLRPKTMTPLIVACALFMEQLDSSIIATALPRIAGSLHTDPLHLNLAITSYMFSLAVFIPLSGWVADRYGARNIFRAAIIVFTLGSAACGMAGSLGALVCARILQGAGGAMMVPVGRLLLLRTIPKAEYINALAWVTAPALIGPVLGPPVGGLIVTYMSWRWIFFINLPIGLLGLELASRYIKDARALSYEPLDFTGFVLVGLSLSGMVFGFEMIGRHLLPPLTIACMIIGGALLFGLYLIHSRRLPHPIVDLSLLSYQTYRASVFGGSMFRIAIGALPFLLPLMLQYGFGLSPARSGLLTFAGAVGAVFMKILSTPTLRAFGFRPVLIFNGAINALFLGGCAFFKPDTPHGVIFLFLLAGGFFRSMQFTALNSIAFAEIPDTLLSRANTLYNMLQQLTLSLGVAIGALALNIALLVRGASDLQAGDFSAAFLAMGLLCLGSILLFAPLPAKAGEEMSGHHQDDAIKSTEHEDPK